MCGINGIYNFDTARPVGNDAIERMNGKMLHRGPDAGGLFSEGNCGLGHRRLKIIDLEGGIQPMKSADQNLVLVFNGEIYNYREIRSQLEDMGHTFRTHSDTEVIIEAYRAFGKDCVDHFRGMFAFALFDKNENSLFICRDRVGIKPLYFLKNEQQFIFSSEIKPILSQLPNKPEVNTSMIDFYFSVGYVPGENTLFKEIHKLLPGHCLEIKNKQIKDWCYWELENPQKTSAISESEAMEKFESILDECVNLRMVSDVPLGAFLSGGLDSSAIVCKMNQLSGSQVKTFSVGYEDAPELSELKYAKQVAEHFGTEHHEYVLKPLDFFESTDLLLQFSEEPIVESAAIALYQLSKVAKESVTVILSGEGGDEILAGYPLHQIMPKIDKLHQLARFVPAPLYQLITSQFARSEKKRKYADWTKLPLQQRYMSISNDVTFGIKQEAYAGQALLDQHQQTSAYYKNLFNHFENATRLQKMTYTDIKSWLPDDLLVKADKMTMAASMELRVPLLDHKLMEFCSQLPDHLRINPKGDKHLLRQLMRQKLPSQIIDRPKQGFPVPLAGWLRNELYQPVADILLDEQSTSRGYFNSEYISSVLKRHRSGEEDLSRRIFSLLTLELWHQKYID